MSKQHGQRYCIVFLALVFVAAEVACVGPAFGSEPAGTFSAPAIEHIDGGRNSGLPLKPSGGAEVRSPLKGDSPTATELLLVTQQSCRLPRGKAPLSALPLFAGGARQGEWVVLAGVGMNDGAGFENEGPVWIETQGRWEPANWYFTVEMLFVPEGRWNLRAGMAIDGEELHDAFAALKPRLNPLHIGIAVAFDLGDRNPLVLDLGYGRMPLEGRILSVPSDEARPDQVLAETRIFSACLNIQF
jgi:hypothetical protein